jgi:hypothetical protein
VSLAALFARKRRTERLEPSEDAEVLRLTVKAELILAELDTVVKQMSTMLRENPNDRP